MSDRRCRRPAIRFHAYSQALLALLLILQPATSFAATPVEAFARLPTFADLEISPGGRYLAARVNVENRYEVKVYDISDSAFEFVYGFREDDTLSVSWFRWVSSDHLLVSIGFSGKRRGRSIVQTEERRLVSLDASTASVIVLFRNKRGKSPVQIQDSVISYLPDDPTHILVQYSDTDPWAPNVYKVDVTQSARHKRISRGHNGILRWMVDSSGEVRLGSGLKDRNVPYLIVRKEGEKEWLDFSHRVNQPGMEFIPVGFAVETNQLYVISNHEGEPSGLYTFDYSTDEFGPLIFKHPTVDISSVRIDEETSELVSVSFVDDDVATVRLSDKPIHEGIERLRKQHPEQSLGIRSISSDGSYAVVREQSTSDAGRYLLYNYQTNRVLQLPYQYPGLAGMPYGRTLAAEYRARDGLVIPAFVTLPPGFDSLEGARNIPFVVFPHGGPSARDFLRFSFTVQFLMSRGFGVLQINFRGSTGYGQEFENAGHREWGQAMQDDITDGVKWLVENDYADAERIAIVGGSYGGYAALMGAVKTPELYQCAISFAGVSDLPDLLQHQRQFVAGSYTTRFIGNWWKDRKMLAENSPARRANEIEIPILLMHGDRDTVVEIDQSAKMAKQLRKSKKKYKYVVLEDGDHHLSLYENRFRYLSEMEKFLDECLN